MNRKHIFSLVVILIATLLFFSWGKDDKSYIKAINLWESGEYKKAINELQQKCDKDSYKTTILIMEIASDWFNQNPSFETQATQYILKSREKIENMPCHVSIKRTEVNSLIKKLNSHDINESVEAQINLIMAAHNDSTGYAASALSHIYKLGIRGIKYENLALIWSLTTYQIINDSLNKQRESPITIYEDIIYNL